MTTDYNALFLALRQAGDTRRKVFVSYHHDQDQAYYDAFSRQYCQQGYNVVQDNSLRDAHDSDDPQYIAQSVRDNNIAGTSCTIVLCGAYTYGRKYVDWETKGTLDKEHGLIGVQLPTAPVNAATNLVTVPSRLCDNITSGYALWITWQDLMSGPEALKARIADALDTNKRPRRFIVNNRDMMRRNTAG
jgi:hypothetical protein